MLTQTYQFLISVQMFTFHETIQLALLSRQKVEFVISYTLYIFPAFSGFYGDFCELFDDEPCVPRDDCEGHFRCLGPFGPIECLDGWQGDECKDTTFVGDLNPDCPDMQVKERAYYRF